MDPDRFDRIAKSMAAPGPRRRVLGGLLGGVLGGAGLLGPLGRGRAAADHGCRHPGRECARDGQCCSGDCRGGTCRCTRAGQCPQPAATEPCKKAVCTATGKCAIRNKTDGATCDGGACQNGGCVASCVPDCAAPETCGGGGTPGECGCAPRTCAADYPGQCGAALDDGCGDELDCSGACAAPQTCGGGGTTDRCGCTPTTCQAIYRACSQEDDCDYGICGTHPDGCGGTLDCGTCGGGHPCYSCGEDGICRFPPGSSLCGAKCCDTCCYLPDQGVCGSQVCQDFRCCPTGTFCCNATDGTNNSSCFSFEECGSPKCCSPGNTCCGSERCCITDANCAGVIVNGVQTTCKRSGPVPNAGCCRI